jgi:putative membrane protein
LAFFFLSVGVTATITYLYIFSINRVGVEILGVPSFSVLKAFMASWTEGQNAPFENLFGRFGQEREVRVSALSFCNTNGMVKAMMIVPAFHPGPFKNVGSSALPYTIQAALEQKLEHCAVSVPHGLSGHDLDLANQAQNQLILDRVLTMSDCSDFGSLASPFVRVKRNGASVGCQVFNGCALLTLTLAPETMEDLPPELNTVIVEAAKKHGFSTAITVDAHNSIQGPFKIDKAIKPLQEAAVESLQKASKHKPTSFSIGTAKVTPKEFGLQDGMGLGGIVTLVIRVGDQKTAYITIDGNNMVSGLRERILSALSEIDVNDGEVFTTDTHAVNAVVLNARGYHPVGEAIDQESLVKYVKQATTDAIASLEPAEVAWRTETVSGVKVIGEKQIEAMCMLLDKAVKRAKKLAISIFPILGVVLGALLLLL